MLTPRDLYELELAHQRAQQEDELHRAEIHADVVARWHRTEAFLDQLFEKQMEGTAA